MCLRSKSLFK